MRTQEALSILGIISSASVQDVKDAYRKIAKATHPDIVKGKEKEFDLATKAYELLTSQTKGRFQVWFTTESAFSVFTSEQIIDFRNELRKRRDARRPVKITLEEANLMRESQFQADFKKAILSVGGVAYKIHGHEYQQSGIPDLYIAHPHWTGWVELKMDKKKPTALQVSAMIQLVRVYVPALVVRSSEGYLSAEFSDSTDLIPLARTYWDRSGRTLINFLREATLKLAIFVNHRVGIFHPEQVAAQTEIFDDK